MIQKWWIYYILFLIALLILLREKAPDVYYWKHTTSEKPILELLKCSNMIIMKPTALESVSPSQASQKQTEYVSAEDSNQYIYIIIGTFVVLFIILIIFLTLHTVKVKNPRREDNPQQIMPSQMKKTTLLKMSNWKTFVMKKLKMNKLHMVVKSSKRETT